MIAKLTRYASFSRSLPSFLYKALAQSYIDKEFPRHIFLEVTASCNLACEFCPREKINNDMDFSLFKSIVDECSNYGARSFSLHLFGEPLLYSRILEAIQYIKEKNRNHTILLTTNGTVLNRFAKSILELGVDKIIWSWRKNNFNDETRKVLRRIGLIRFLIEETPEGEIEKWKGYEKEVKHLHNYGGHIDTTRWGIMDVRNSLDEKQIRYPCYHLWLAPAIRWNGEITICCNDPHGVESCGAYGRNTLREIWMGEKIKILREGHLKGGYKGLCKDCNVWKTYPDMFFSFQKHVQSTSS